MLLSLFFAKLLLLDSFCGRGEQGLQIPKDPLHGSKLENRENELVGSQVPVSGLPEALNALSQY